MICISSYCKLWKLWTFTQHIWNYKNSVRIHLKSFVCKSTKYKGIWHFFLNICFVFQMQIYVLKSWKEDCKWCFHVSCTFFMHSLCSVGLCESHFNSKPTNVNFQKITIFAKFFGKRIILKNFIKLFSLKIWRMWL